jgi:hypothetical protein
MFPPFVVLIGACLVTIGARWPVLNLPVLGDLNLMEMYRTEAWTVCIASALAVPLAWFGRRGLAGLAVVVAVAALACLFGELYSKLSEMKAAGMLADVEKVMRGTRIKPGAVCVGGGLLLQCVALMFRPKMHAGNSA